MGLGALGERDFGNLDFRVRLAMAVELADALLRLVVEDENFLGLGLAKDRSRNGGAVERRGPNLQRVIAAGENAMLPEFKSMFEANAITYAQPSVTKVGGVTQMRKVMALWNHAFAASV